MQDTFSVPTETLLSRFLITPVEDFLSRPRKDLRGDVVTIGFLLYSVETHSRDSHNIKVLSSILEWIHSGSLIIDDIQDMSLTRRGDQCLHLKYGISCAINAANWMYFEAIKKVDLIDIEPVTKARMMNLILEMMTLAHQGQALDIMSDVRSMKREDVYEVGEKTHALKSGEIFSLSLKLGALLANPDADISFLGDLGLKIGCSLQRFDDLGNFSLNNQSDKALEDLKLGRPSWPWMYVAKHRNENDFDAFKEAVSYFPDESKLSAFLEKTNIRSEAILLAQDLHNEIEHMLDTSFPGINAAEGVIKLRKILQKVKDAYI